MNLDFLNKMDASQLAMVIGEARVLRDAIVAEERKLAKRQIRELIELHGFTQDELFKICQGVGNKAGSPCKGSAISIARARAKAEYESWYQALPEHAKQFIDAFRSMPKAGMAWQSPSDRNIIWYGKGRYPTWLLRHLAAGGRHEALLVTE